MPVCCDPVLRLLVKHLSLERKAIWVGGFWPNKAPFRRAARRDGAFPLKSGSKMTGKDLREIRAYIEIHRESARHFDLVITGYTPGDDPPLPR